MTSLDTRIVRFAAYFRLSLCVLIAAAALAFPTQRAAAATTFTVNVQSDLADYQPGDGICDATPPAPDAPATPDCTLRAAIMEANATPGAATINLPAGIYTLGKKGVNEDKAQTGDLDITDALQILGAGRDKTIIDGAGIDRVFDLGFNKTRFAATISKVTIRHGQTEDVSEQAYSGQGGGIRSVGADLALTNVVLSDNVADREGGGLAASDGTVTVANSSIHHNAGRWGGGIGTDAMTKLAVSATTVQNNTASSGGGISHAGPLTLTSSTISGNDAEYAGGIFSGGTLTAQNTTISGNEAVFGGGVVVGTTAKNSSLTHVTIATNYSQARGGGIHTEGDMVQPSISASLITANKALEAGPDCSGTVRTKGYNLWTDINGCTRVGNIAATPDIVNILPVLSPLQNNGGATPTHLPRGDSPTIDGAAPANTCGVASDQRDGKRPIDGNADGKVRCDIGAVEYNGPVLKTLSPSTRPIGSPAFTLTVTGVNFTAKSVVYWKGTPRPTQFVNATTLKAQISADDQKTMQEVGIRVVTPGAALTSGQSNKLTVKIVGPSQP